jgi:hypothetical protein
MPWKISRVSFPWQGEDKMPIKNSRTEVNIHVDYNDVDKAINAFYGIKSYEMVAYEELSNDTAVKIDVTADPLTDPWDLKRVAETRAGKPAMWCLRTLLQDMCAAGDILPGQYIISVSW